MRGVDKKHPAALSDLPVLGSGRKILLHTCDDVGVQREGRANAMLSLFGPARTGYCDGVTRRDFLKVGGLALGGLSLPGLLRAESQSGVRRSHKAVIMIFLAGGPAHQDMFDLKPHAPKEIAGPWRPIATSKFSSFALYSRLWARMIPISPRGSSLPHSTTQIVASPSATVRLTVSTAFNAP